MNNFLQSEIWAEANRKMGHKAIYEKVEGAVVLMIIKDAKRGRYMEIPGGPLIEWGDAKAVKKFFEKIRKIAKENRCGFIRFRPQIFATADNMALMKKIGARRAPMHLHAERTVILDLTKSEEELMAEMRRQTRYEVRRAEKMGITVKKSNSVAIFKEFHAEQSTTAARQHFIPPDLKTLLAERDAFSDAAVIYTSYTPEDEALAYGLILKYGEEADYFEAASTEKNKKLPGAYALQWQIIRDLKKEGFSRYNLWGIAPPEQPNHRYAGVTTFKTGFGGEIVDFVLAEDIVVSWPKYLINLVVENIRKKRRHL